MANCSNCKSWWELCQECDRIETKRAESMEKLRRAMERDRRQVCCYGASDSNWNDTEMGLHGKTAIIR